jgi:hypothetical protein
VRRRRRWRWRRMTMILLTWTCYKELLMITVE